MMVEKETINLNNAIKAITKEVYPTITIEAANYIKMSFAKAYMTIMNKGMKDCKQYIVSNKENYKEYLKHFFCDEGRVKAEEKTKLQEIINERFCREYGITYNG